MSTIQELFQQGQLAEAAYSDFSVYPNDAYRALTTGDGKFSATQASEFITHWQVVSHIPNLDSGFSATVFESLDHPGEFSLAIRGSMPDQSGIDFLADAQLIATDGVAVSQLVDLYNYWQSLTHNGVYDAARLTTQATASLLLGALYIGNGGNLLQEAITYATDLNIPINSYDAARAYFVNHGYVVEGGKVYVVEKYPSTSLFHSTDERYTGTGKLIGESVSVSGHSLGGHLAMAFSRLFPGFTNDVTSINGLGFKIGDANINNLFAALGGANTFDAGTIENVYGIAGFEFAAMNNSVLQQPGGWDGIFIESATLPISVALGHSTSQMTDSLAVANLFIQLDSSFANQSPAQVLTKLNAIFEQSSKTPEKSLEALVISLRQLILGEQSPLIATDDREALYSSISTLQGSALFKALEGKVTLVPPPTSASEARTDLGAFLSLFYLTPFAFKVEDAGALNLLYAVHQALADKWNDDRNLSPEQIANGEANFSDLYLADRAFLLKALVEANQKDSDTYVAGVNADNADYTDSEKNITVHVVKNILVTPGSVPTIKVIFGDIENNTLTGAEESDHLYGLGGSDTLNGGKGNDYLEGGTGNDTLNGNEDRDTLIGGDGEDILNGGAGNDQLKGGAGVDIYQFTDTYGTDVITDTDGSGVITVDNMPITGGKTMVDGIYYNAMTHTTYARVGPEGHQTLYIRKEGDDSNQIIVNDWSSAHNLNITLDAPDAAPDATLVGDFKKKIDDHSTTDTNDDTYVITDGNYTRDPDAVNGEPGAADLINGTNAVSGVGGEDAMYGLAGDDYLNGKSGDDYIDGGSGGDYIQGGLGKDTLKGGDGDDLIFGSSDLDITQPESVDFYHPDNTFQYQQATGFNWVAGYNDADSYINGTPNAITSNAPRNRLADDQGNVIDGGAGMDRPLLKVTNDTFWKRSA